MLNSQTKTPTIGIAGAEEENEKRKGASPLKRADPLATKLKTNNLAAKLQTKFYFPYKFKA